MRLLHTMNDYFSFDKKGDKKGAIVNFLELFNKSDFKIRSFGIKR